MRGWCRSAVAVRAGDGAPLFDHVLVDDYQDTTLAAEALLQGLGARSVVVAADPAAHVFSFQGRRACRSSGSPPRRSPAPRMSSSRTDHRRARRASRRTPGSRAHTLRGARRDRARAPPRPRRGRRRRGASSRWSCGARARTSGTCCARSTTRGSRARCPSAGARSRLRVGHLPLRAGAAMADRRPGPPRGADRAAADVDGGRALAGGGARRDPAREDDGPEPRAAAAALDRTDGLDARGSGTGRARAGDPRQGGAVRGHVGAGRVQGPVGGAPVFRPSSSRRADPELDTVVTFANVVAEASEQGDAGVAAFLEALDAGEHGPGWTAREAARRRRRAGADRPRRGRPGVRHRARRGRHRGELPVAVATRADVRPGRRSTAPAAARSRCGERLEDERRLFRMVLGRARRGVVLVAADTHPDADELTPALAVRRRAGRRLGAGARPDRRGPGERARGGRDLAPPARGPGRRGLAPARRARGPPRARRRPVDRGGSSATGPTPGRPLHETLRALVLAHVEPGQLRAAARARRRARTRPRRGLPGVGGQARAQHHRGHRARQGRQDQAGDPRRGRPRAGASRSSPRRPCRRPTASWSTSACSRTGGSSTARKRRSATRCGSSSTSRARRSSA